MKRTVSAGDARKRLGELLEGVFYRGDEVVIERAGKVMAVVIPAERYEAMERGRDRLFKMAEAAQQRNQDASPAEIEREIERAIAEARREGPANA